MQDTYLPIGFMIWYLIGYISFELMNYYFIGKVTVKALLCGFLFGCFGVFVTLSMLWLAIEDKLDVVVFERKKI